MKIKNNQKIATFFAISLLVLTIGLTTVIPPTIGQTTTSKFATYAYIGATPNPVGVGQETLLHIGITQQYQSLYDGWKDLTVTVTKPDGTNETLGPFNTDPTGGTGTIYVPTMTGEYILQTHFPEQVNDVTQGGSFGPSIPAGTIMLASESAPLTLTVQEDPLPLYPGHPLPSEYWSRPIDAQLIEWNALAGNWQRSPNNLVTVGNEDAPETAHILWTKPLVPGGIVGAETGDKTFTTGDAYQGQFANSVIMNGILYYNIYPEAGAKADYPVQGIKAVDLRTGEELWFRNGTRLSFGQLIYVDSMNMHGAYAYLWSVSGNRWTAYDAFNGEYAYSMHNVPSGVTLIGPNNEILIYTVNSRGWMTLWNSTTVVNTGDGTWEFGRYWNPLGYDYDASLGYMWNKTIPTGLTGAAYAEIDNKVVGRSVSNTAIKTWALSVQEGCEGQLLFSKTWNAPSSWLAGNLTISSAAGSIEDGLMTVWCKETQQFWGFSTDTGDKMWGPTEPQNYLDFLGLHSYIVDGKFISQGMSGIVYCYDAQSGQLLWTYMADDPYNQVLWANQWHIRPLFFADGKLYMGTSEHSPVDPKPRGAAFSCIYIENGTEVFRANSLFRQTDWGGRAIIGDSIIATLDTYDQRIYAIGKGPSATTVNAPEVSIDFGKSLVLSGTVTDISAGTETYEVNARFPNGVPAVADECMSDWMLYVYKQFEKPTNATGVPVELFVIDSNNNYRSIGTAITDSSGFYSLHWEPDISGKYTVYAQFAGTKAYWPSQATTAFAVDDVEATPSPTETPPSTVEQYFWVAIVAIIAVIVICFIITILLLRKKE